MDIWDLLSAAAWAISALLLLWMVVDAWRVGRTYDDSLLLSSQEGVDELFAEPTTSHTRNERG
jgi:hypothetical protein